MITIETDLIRDFEASQTRAREAMDMLLALDVEVTSFLVSGWPGVDRVTTVGRLWHPDPCGKDMIILPVWRGPGPLYEPDPILIDLLAFTTGDPDTWYYRVGGPGPVLGDDHLHRALAGRLAIHLHEDPLAWLQADCEGAVILEDAERRRDRERMADGWRAAA
jgi:hypothetical protein